MLDASIVNGVQKYIYIGTACSYPVEKQSISGGSLLVEDDAYPAIPESSYGWSKLMGEYECGLASIEGKIEVGILRIHNVYGPPCELSPEKSQVIPALCRKVINYPLEEFVVWGSGKQRRAFVYVEDAVDALESVMEKGIGKGVIQIGPSKSYSISDIADKIVKISGKTIPVIYDQTKPEGNTDRMADWTKAKEILGWKPKVNIDDGLHKTYQWCLKYLNRI
jgi:nucleoside-diphosphate-sugar epimerase